MSNGDSEMSNLPAWLQLFIAAVSGAAIAVATMVKLGFSFNNRLQRIENQDLDKIIEAHMEKERHDKIYPMLQDRVFRPLDKIEDEMKMQGQNIAVLLERDRTVIAFEKTTSSLDKLIATLNQQAMNPKS